MKLKKLLIIAALFATATVALWQIIIVLSVLCMRNLPEGGYLQSVGSLIVAEAGPKRTAKHAIKAAAKCDYFAWMNDEVNASSESRTSAEEPYSSRKVKDIPDKESNGMGDDSWTRIFACNPIETLTQINKRYSLNEEPYVSMIVEAALDIDTHELSANALLLVLQEITGESFDFRFCEWHEIKRSEGEATVVCLAFPDDEIERSRSKLKQWHAEWKTKRTVGRILSPANGSYLATL